jgi:hypothetical protein
VPDIAKSIEAIQKGRIGGSLSNEPIFGNKNPFDQALRDKLKSSNVGYANNSNSSYVDIEEQMKDKQNVLSNLIHR